MTPNLPLPTDNIYKFACLFGLVLIVTSIFAFASIYNSSLNRKILYLEAIIPLEAKTQRTKIEEDLLKMNRRLLGVTKSNGRFAGNFIAVILAVGSMLSVYGATQWHRIIQRRDDQLADLQIRKLQAELNNLEHE